MLDLLVSVLAALRSLLKSERDRTFEILALRQQLAIYKRVSKRPKLRAGERIFWVWMSCLGETGEAASSSSRQRP